MRRTVPLLRLSLPFLAQIGRIGAAELLYGSSVAIGKRAIHPAAPNATLSLSLPLCVMAAKLASSVSLALCVCMYSTRANNG